MLNAFALAKLNLLFSARVSEFSSRSEFSSLTANLACVYANLAAQIIYDPVAIIYASHPIVFETSQHNNYVDFQNEAPHPT